MRIGSNLARVTSAGVSARRTRSRRRRPTASPGRFRFRFRPPEAEPRPPARAPPRPRPPTARARRALPARSRVASPRESPPTRARTSAPTRRSVVSPRGFARRGKAATCAPTASGPPRAPARAFETAPPPRRPAARATASPAATRASSASTLAVRASARSAAAVSIPGVRRERRRHGGGGRRGGEDEGGTGDGGEEDPPRVAAAVAIPPPPPAIPPLPPAVSPPRARFFLRSNSARSISLCSSPSASSTSGSHCDSDSGPTAAGDACLVDRLFFSVFFASSSPPRAAFPGRARAPRLIPRCFANALHASPPTPSDSPSDPNDDAPPRSRVDVAAAETAARRSPAAGLKSSRRVCPLLCFRFRAARTSRRISGGSASSAPRSMTLRGSESAANAAAPNEDRAENPAARTEEGEVLGASEVFPGASTPTPPPTPPRTSPSTTLAAKRTDPRPGPDALLFIADFSRERSAARGNAREPPGGSEGAIPPSPPSPRAGREGPSGGGSSVTVASTPAAESAGRDAPPPPPPSPPRRRTRRNRFAARRGVDPGRFSF